MFRQAATKFRRGGCAPRSGVKPLGCGFYCFDELFKGTNIEDAVQITSATIKGLSNCKNSFFFISTHLHQIRCLGQVKEKQVDTYFMDCDIKNNIPAFNYEIKEGWSELKVGQLLFEKEGLNKLLHTL